MFHLELNYGRSIDGTTRPAGELAYNARISAQSAGSRAVTLTPAGRDGFRRWFGA